MNSSDYGIVSRLDMPDKMNESMSVPPLICRDVKATKRRFNAVNGNVFSTPGTEIRIPLAANAVIGAGNVNLNLSLTFTGSAGNIVADSSWFALFSQIRIESGAGSSIILEQVDDPGVVASFIMQYTYSANELTKENARGLGVYQLPAAATNILTKSGTTIAYNAAASAITLDLSTVMGLFTTSLPLYNTNGVTVVLTLNQVVASAVLPTTVTGITVTNPYITCNCLEGGESYEKQLADIKSKNGEVSVMFNTVRRYIQSQTTTGATTATLLINDRAKSCLGFFAVARATADVADGTKYKNSASGFDVYKNHNYNIAGMMYPMAGISSESEAIDESYDTLQHLSRKGNKTGGVLGRTQSSPVTAYDGTAAGSSGILCVNLSKCSADEHVWGKGLNLSGSNLSNFLQVQYTPADAQTVNIYSIFQMKVHIDKMGGFSTEF